MNVDKADISFAPFNTTNVRSVQVTDERQRLLRHPLLFPEASHVRTKQLLDLSLTLLIHPANGITFDDVKSTDFKYPSPPSAARTPVNSLFSLGFPVDFPVSPVVLFNL